MTDREGVGSDEQKTLGLQWSFRRCKGVTPYACRGNKL